MPPIELSLTFSFRDFNDFTAGLSALSTRECLGAIFLQCLWDTEMASEKARLSAEG